MPGKGLPSGQRAPLRPVRPRQPPPARQDGPGSQAGPSATAKVLYTVDAGLTAASPVTDIGELTGIARAAVAAGQGHVLGTSHVIFPNGAITLVLILAESHLSIHTWPEEDLIAIDLFSCGTIAGERVLAELSRLLRLRDVRVRRVSRGRSRG